MAQQEEVKLPEGWINTTIGEVCDKPIQRKPEDDESFHYIDIGSVNRSAKTIEGASEIVGKDAPSRARKIVDEGDVIVSMTRPNLNAVAKINREYSGQVASTGFDVLKPILVEPDWIFSTVKSEKFIQAVSGITQGALYPACKAADIRNFEFGMPPLPEQKRIVEKLGSLLAQVGTIQQRLNNLPDIIKRFRQSVLAAAVSGKLTEQWRKDNQCIEAKQVLLEDLLKDKKHLSYGVLKPGDEDLSGVPMIRVMDLTKTGEITGTNILNISKELSDKYKRTIVEEGDIILAVMATIGRAALVPKTLVGANVNRALAVIKLNSRICSKYFHYQIMSPFFQNEFVNKKLGTAQKRINLSGLRLFQVILPEKKEQTEIVRLVEQYFALADTLEKNLANAKQRVDNLTQSILAKAFKGELVPQDPSDEPADKLLERIKAAREQAEALEKAAKKAAKSSKASKSRNKK